MLRKFLTHVCTAWVVTVLFSSHNNYTHGAFDFNVVYSNNARFSSTRIQGDRVAKLKPYEMVVATPKLVRVGPLAYLRGGRRS